jgi:hypothetical protein
MLDTTPETQSIAIYVINHPRLSTPESGRLFSWLATDQATEAGLEGLLGTYDPKAIQWKVDEAPAGPAWNDLLEGLKGGRYHTVVTHLAPLTAAQRQQLIGICAICGAQLVTPGNAIGAPQPTHRAQP